MAEQRARVRAVNVFLWDHLPELIDEELRAEAEAASAALVEAPEVDQARDRPLPAIRQRVWELLQITHAGEHAQELAQILAIEPSRCRRSRATEASTRSPARPGRRSRHEQAWPRVLRGRWYGLASRPTVRPVRMSGPSELTVGCLLTRARDCQLIEHAPLRARERVPPNALLGEQFQAWLLPMSSPGPTARVPARAARRRADHSTGRRRSPLAGTGRAVETTRG